jgi:hypothetical protein
MACIEKYKAPNGEFSHLHAQLVDQLGSWRGDHAYLEIHDEAFKTWFGDWESEYGLRNRGNKNAGTFNRSEGPGEPVPYPSLDENWEPKIFWHGTNTDKIKSFNQEENNFTTDRESAEDYAREMALLKGGSPKVYPVYLRIRQRDLRAGHIKINGDRVIVTADARDSIKSIENDGNYSKWGKIFESSIKEEQPEMDPKKLRLKLIDSAALIQAPTGENANFYGYQGKSLDRTSTKVDKYVRYRGDESGKAYSDVGTKYHKIMELLVNGASPEHIGDLSNELVRAGFPPIDDKIEGAFIREMWYEIQELRKTGELIAEFRAARIDKGYAGTIDLLYIDKKTGKARIYDLKTAHETPWKKNPPEGTNMTKDVWSISDFNYYKAERYALQTAYYEDLISAGDTVTDRPPLQVEGIFVMPTEVKYDDQGNVALVRLLPTENVKQWSRGSGRSFYSNAVRQVKNDLENQEIAEGFKGRPTGLGDSGNFLRQALGAHIDSTEALDARATNFVERNSDEKTFTLMDEKPVAWRSDNKQDRIAQVKELFIRMDQNHAGNMTSGVETFFGGEFRNPKASSAGSMFTLKHNTVTKEGAITVTYARSYRLHSILNYSNAKNVIKLSTIKGFEQYSDVMLVHRGDGAYDLLTFTNIPHYTRFDVKNKDKNFTRKLRVDGDSIYGNHFSPYTSENLGVTLQNNFGDFTRMRLGLIALELQKENPSMNVNSIIVDYIADKSLTSPHGILLDQLTPQISHLNNIEAIKPIMPERIREVIGTARKSNLAAGDALAELNTFLQAELSEPFADKLSKQIDRFSRNEITRDELANELMNGVNGMRHYLRQKNLKSADVDQMKNLLSSDPYFMALARAWVVLKGMGFDPEKDVSDQFLGQITYWIKSPTATGRKTLDKFFDLFRQHVDNIKQEMQKFLHVKEPVFRDLVNEDPLVKRGIPVVDSHAGGSDAILAMTRSVMEPLIMTRLDKKGNKYKVPWLWAEDSPEFKRLTVAQRAAIKFFNDQVQLAAPGKWQRGQIPIIRTSSSTKWFRAKSSLGKGDFRSAAANTNEAVKIFWDYAAERGNFRTLDDDRSFQDVAYDQFGGQTYVENGTINFNSQSLKQIGLDPQLNLIDGALNTDFETDLEKVITLFRSHYIKKTEMDKALPIYQIYRSIFKYYELAHGFKQTNTIRMMDEYVNDLVFNTKVAEDAALSKAMNVSMRLASMALIGFNPNVFLGNTLQMWLASTTDALTNTITSDPRFPGVKSWAKATGIMTAAMKDTAEMTKLTLLRQKYLPEDLSVLIGEKHQKTARGLINEQLAYALDRSMEVGVRTHHLVAQMVKDGTYDAHYVTREKGEDGIERWVVKYDKNKDPRFSGEDGKLFYDALKKSMREKGELDATGEITGAYDWHLRERLKAYINQGIGTFDRDLASPWARHSLMFAISQFRNWFTQRFQRITKLPYDAEIMGDYKKVNDEVVWSSEPMKGLLWTLSDMHSIVKKAAKGEWKEVSQTDKRNLTYMSISTGAALVLFALSVALLEDDDDEDYIRFKVITSNNIADLMSFVTAGPYGTILTSPAVFASYFSRVFDNMGQAIVYGFDGDTEEAWRKAKEVIPIVNRFPESE